MEELETMADFSAMSSLTGEAGFAADFPKCKDLDLIRSPHQMRLATLRNGRNRNNHISFDYVDTNYNPPSNEEVIIGRLYNSNTGNNAPSMPRFRLHDEKAALHSNNITSSRDKNIRSALRNKALERIRKIRQIEEDLLDKIDTSISDRRQQPLEGYKNETKQQTDHPKSSKDSDSHQNKDTLDFVCESLERLVCGVNDNAIINNDVQKSEPLLNNSQKEKRSTDDIFLHSEIATLSNGTEKRIHGKKYNNDNRRRQRSQRQSDLFSHHNLDNRDDTLDRVLLTGDNHGIRIYRA